MPYPRVELYLLDMGEREHEWRRKLIILPVRRSIKVRL